MIRMIVTLQVLFGSLGDRIDRRDETGATAVEYGLMVALIAGVIIGAVTLIGTNLDALFRRVAASLT